MVTEVSDVISHWSINGHGGKWRHTTLICQWSRREVTSCHIDLLDLSECISDWPVHNFTELNKSIVCWFIVREGTSIPHTHIGNAVTEPCQVYHHFPLCVCVSLSASLILSLICLCISLCLSLPPPPSLSLSLSLSGFHFLNYNSFILVRCYN